MPGPESAIEQAYQLARERYEALGVDVAAALDRLAGIAVSVHCWQGDDVGGFEGTGAVLGGGIAVTGNYPGKARTPDELRADLEQAYALIPGRHRLNLHASYGEFGGRAVDRDAVEPEHFGGWAEWARAQGLGVDFNPTFFSHPRASDGYTLAHADPGVRQFWVDHGIACRAIGAMFGRELGSACITNFWVPDGSKDTPVDRKGPRERLAGRSTRSWPGRSTRTGTATRSRPSCSASGRRLTSSARTSSTSATRSPVRRRSASTPGTSTRPR